MGWLIDSWHLMPTPVSHKAHIIVNLKHIIRSYIKIQLTFHARHLFIFEENWEKMKLNELGRENCWLWAEHARLCNIVLTYFGLKMENP